MVALAMVIAAALNWWVGQKLNRPLREAYADHLHSLFWIPMEWWSVAMIAGAVLALFGLI
jgi:hypothetical protein